MNPIFADIRSALFLPASNARAIEKARGLACDMVILDLEDAVKPEAKEAARAAAVAAVAERVRRARRARSGSTGRDSGWHEADVAALRGSRAQARRRAEGGERRRGDARRRRVRQAAVRDDRDAGGACSPRRRSQRRPGVAGLIAGINDLAATLRLPPGAGRGPLALALQTIVLAARAAGIVALDGVWNALDDAGRARGRCAAPGG